MTMMQGTLPAESLEEPTTVAVEATDEALEAAAEMTSTAHGTGHPPMC